MAMTKGGLLAIIISLVLAACTSRPVAVSVPPSLQGGADESLAMIVPAKGVQIYECRPRREQVGAFEWFFVAPEADLFDQRGDKVGRHYAGPHWEANDGSKLLGTLKARADAPAPGAIPWLLLAAKSVGPQGSFSRVTSIQRLNTAGGLPPADGCTPASSGATARVPYSADYYFLSRK